MQTQLELLAEVEAVFATKNSNSCKFMQGGKLRKKAKIGGSNSNVQRYIYTIKEKTSQIKRSVYIVKPQHDRY